MTVTPRTLAAWRATEYRADTPDGPARVRIGRRSAAIDAWLDGAGLREAAFVTAWNPHGARRPPGWNNRMMRQLERVVRHLPTLAGWGVGDGWREAHLLIGAAPGRARQVGRRFRQAGIVVVHRGRPARLVLLDRAGSSAGQL